VLLGNVIGMIVGLALGRRLPVRVRRYSPSRGVVQVKFDNPNIAARVREAARPPRNTQRRM
jgi:hypothetical protein